MPATLTRRHMEPLEQAGSRYAELMRLGRRCHDHAVTISFTERLTQSSVRPNDRMARGKASYGFRAKDSAWIPVLSRSG